MIDTKYIVFEQHGIKRLITFSADLDHSLMRDLLHEFIGEPISAGVIQSGIDPDDRHQFIVVCSGSSHTLGLKADKYNDNILANKMFGNIDGYDGTPNWIKKYREK